MSSLRTKLWMGFGGLLLILLTVSALSALVLTRFSNTLERVFRENYGSAVFCDNMKASLDQLNIRAQDLIWQTTPPAIDAQQQRQKFQENLDHQLGNLTLPREKELSNHLADLWNDYWNHYVKFENAEADRAELYRQDLLPRYEQLMQTAQSVADMNISNMISVDGRVKSTLVEVRNALLLSVVAGTLLSSLVVWVTGSAVLRQLAALTRSARQIEAGDLDLHLNVKSHDEIGQLAEAFNSMTERLREFRRVDHERLAASRQTTQLAIDSLPDGVFVIGPGGKIEISNRTAETYFGIRPGMYVADLKIKWLTNLHDTILADKKPIEPQGYQSAIQLFENGEEHFLLPRAMPMLNDRQNLIGVTVILVDVTRLRRADEAKSSLVSTVSHELRTPLTSIRMALGLLTGGKLGPLAPKQEILLGTAREDSDRLHRILENLLNMSRIEAGSAQFQFLPVLPREIIAAALQPLRPAFAEKNLELELDVPENLPAAPADSAAIASALGNLLSNALKFTPAGGKVRIVCRSETDCLAFTVADTGPGIPPQYQSRIFEKFFRVPRPAGPTGAGLGLAIAREIIEAHGGRIECANSENGDGAVFRFTLPLRREIPSAALSAFPPR
jgi:signal transduction histidine kinase